MTTISHKIATPEKGISSTGPPKGCQTDNKGCHFSQPLRVLALEGASIYLLHKYKHTFCFIYKGINDKYIYIYIRIYCKYISIHTHTFTYIHICDLQTSSSFFSEICHLASLSPSDISCETTAQCSNTYDSEACKACIIWQRCLRIFGKTQHAAGGENGFTTRKLMEFSCGWLLLFLVFVAVCCCLLYCILMIDRCLLEN